MLDLTGVAATVNKYSKRTAIVQTGWKSQLVAISHHLFFDTRLTETGFGDDGNLYYCNMHHLAGHHYTPWSDRIISGQNANHNIIPISLVLQVHGCNQLFHKALYVFHAC
jgi:hypothetical protein